MIGLLGIVKKNESRKDEQEFVYAVRIGSSIETSNDTALAPNKLILLLSTKASELSFSMTWVKSVSSVLTDIFSISCPPLFDWRLPP